MPSRQVVILGAGITGLAAAYASGFPVYEATERAGGICCSYYVRPGFQVRLFSPPKDEEVYHFEIGGGHWIFGGDPLVLRFIRSLTPIKSYSRRSAVYFPERDLLVPYPIQNNLRYLGQKIAARVLEELYVNQNSRHNWVTMADWLKANFGSTLYELFFEPFHELYTAGLFRQIAPQDAYKTPVDLSLVIRGAFKEVVSQVGYNINFVYPEKGLNALVQCMLERCQIYHNKRVVKIDVESKEIYFNDGTSQGYEKVISTLPLNEVLEITGLDVGEPPDPATSVLVVNIGATKGPRCPSEHWLYIPKSRAGFHRVGFYSNVDPSFLPASARERQDHVSIYVEKSFRQDEKLTETQVSLLCEQIVKELQDWGWIKEIEVIDPSWVHVAYTWSWPGSKWRSKAIQALEECEIYQAGRYGRWVFQGIADSIRDGFLFGTFVKSIWTLQASTLSGSRSRQNHL